MAYQTGTADNTADLLNKLKGFASAQGWSINKSQDNLLYLRQGANYWALEVQDDNLYVIACTGFNDKKDCFEQPGASCQNSLHETKTCVTHLNAGAFVSYDFFGNAQYLHVCVQYTRGRFRHFGIGTLNKEGDYTGGQYAFGTYIAEGYERRRNNASHVYGMSSGSRSSGAVVRADKLAKDTRTPWYFVGYNYNEDYTNLDNNERGCYMLTNGRADNAQHHPECLLLINSQSKFGNMLLPVPNAPIAHCKDNLFRRLGTVPDRYECRMRGVIPRQILTINDERWMIVPAAQYQPANVDLAPDGEEFSGEYGVAYRIIE